MIEIKFQAFYLENFGLSIDKNSGDAVIVRKPELVYETTRYFHALEKPSVIINEFKETCLKQKFSRNERLRFVSFQPASDGFIYKTSSENYEYVTMIVGWEDWTSNVNKSYEVKEVMFSDVDSSTTTIVRKFKDDDSRLNTLVGHLCPDFEWELDETNIGFPISYCTQNGVTVSYDFHGLY